MLAEGQASTLMPQSATRRRSQRSRARSSGAPALDVDDTTQSACHALSFVGAAAAESANNGAAVAVTMPTTYWRRLRLFSGYRGVSPG